VTTATTGFGVYVHWPFCLSKCPYCDFNSMVAPQPIDQTRFAAAIEREIAATATRIGSRQVSSIFFGGGTPSLMEAESVTSILDAIARHFQIAGNVEITLEANPTSVEATRFAGYASTGVNRLSLGIQAFDDTALKMLGRTHSVNEARAALELAQRHFTRTSCDLIYARPGQTPEQWRAELGLAIKAAGEHLSLYQLTIERGTPFFERRRARELTPPDEEQARVLYDLTQEVCSAAGLPAYEISNHARPGGACRHNLLYWRGGEYAGVGPGAHGRLDIDGVRHAIETERQPQRWLMRVEAQGNGVVVDEELGSEARGDEFLLMGLRLTEGIDPERYAELAGRKLNPRRIALLREEGVIAIDAEGRLRVTSSGFPLLDAVVADLAA